MSHCHDEHRHSHGHGHGHEDHDHEDGPDRGLDQSLFKVINVDLIRTLNESVDGAGKKIFKPWGDRFDMSKFVESDADEQLIFFIPFTANVKLKSIAVLGGSGELNPTSMKAYINREDVDFDTVESIQPPDGTWDLLDSTSLQSSSTSTVPIPEYPTRMSKFTNVRNLTLYFPSNAGADTTRIYFIGLKGEWTEISRDPVITMYEAAPNPADHKNLQVQEASQFSVN
ncbi:galactose-binding domain-like protein [Zopfochytrium polystomum]|nr:galactose-binding domain-like protein [Zopfochytrium polystomum]